MNIYYQNVRSIRSKSWTFYLNVLNNNYDIIALTETWLDSSFHDSQFFDDRYSVFRCDRNVNTSYKLRGGGVLLACHNKYSPEIISDLHNDLLESLWIKMKINNAKDLLVNIIYFPPSSSFQTYDLYSNIIENCNSLVGCDVIILGDFNLPLITNSTFNLYNGNNKYIRIKELIDYMNLTSFNNIQNTHAKTLDLVLSKINNILVTDVNDPLTNIDDFHPPLLIVVSKPINSHRKLPRTHFGFDLNFKRGDFVRFYYLIRDIDWNFLHLTNDVNTAVDYFYQHIFNCFNRCFPVIKHSKRNYPIWFNKQIIQKIKIKNKLRLRSRKSSYYLPLFKKARSSLKKDMKKAFKDYINLIQSDINTDSTSLFNFVKSKKRNLQSSPSFYFNDLSYTDPRDIANVFAKYFESVYDPQKPSYNLTFDNDCENTFEDTFNFTTISLDEIKESINNLKPSKSRGPDGIPSYIIKGCMEYFLYPLLIIFNLSIRTRIFPDVWKLTKISPIYKNGNKSQVSNYRPIALLCGFAKVFEHILHKRIYFYFKKFICSQQHGFVQKRSTITNLINFVQYTTDILSTGGQVDVIYTDFSKAFDKTNHDILLKKLFNYGFSSSSLTFFRSYLCNRMQYVSYFNYDSFTYPSNSGIPQGSNLGPLLFLIFINDFPCNLIYTTCLIYADDIKIFRPIYSLDDCYKLQHDLDTIYQWSISNKLYFNYAKCFHMTYHRGRNPINWTYHIDIHNLQQVITFKDLGVTFDFKLHFDTHKD